MKKITNVWIVEDSDKEAKFIERFFENEASIKIERFGYTGEVCKAEGRPDFIFIDVSSLTARSGMSSEFWLYTMSLIHDKFTSAIIVIYSYLLRYAEEVIEEMVDVDIPVECLSEAGASNIEKFIDARR